MKQSVFHNPLDQLFNVEDNGTDYALEYAQVNENQIEVLDAEPAQAPVVTDSEDRENDAKIDRVYNMAMAAFEDQNAIASSVDEKFAARNAEVAANFLNIALNAATAKAKLKNDRRRVTQFIPNGQNTSKTTNNVIVASQEDIMKMINKDD